MKIKYYFLLFFLAAPSLYKSQCAVSISPGDTIHICTGDSVLLTASATGGGASVLDQSQTNYNAGTSARTLPGYSHWQDFTAGATGIMDKIDLGFFNFINGSGTLTFYAGTGTGGVQLSTQTINVNCPSGNCTLPFVVNVPVTSGQVYTFHFIPGTGMPDPYGVQVELPGTYAGGEFNIVDPSGTYPTGFDMVFRTYVAASLNLIWAGGSTDSTLMADSAGIYSVRVSNGSGCVDTDTVWVIEDRIDTTISQTGGSLVSADSLSAYQWIDCNADTLIPGATNRSFTPTESGNFAVIVTNNNCSDTSACIFVLVTETSPVTNQTILLYPNPTSGKIHINTIAEGKMTIELSDLQGRKVTGFELNSSGEFDISPLPSGIYHLQVNMGETSVSKIISKL